MTLPVFLVEGLVAGVGDRVALDGDEGRHAVMVKRLRAGEQLVLSDGAGFEATAEVVETGKASLVARVVRAERLPRPAPRLIVVQAIPKGERAELAVEVLTEVGADVIVPWAAARCVAVWRGDRASRSLAKWRRTAREAGKQARRAWLPEVREQADTAEVARLLAGADVGVVLHEDATSDLADLPLADAREIVLVVGPEGGISPDELAAFGGAAQVRLGSEVLRTSTAGVAAAGAVLSRTDRWRHHRRDRGVTPG